jgi:hypothetical protein
MRTIILALAFAAVTAPAMATDCYVSGVDLGDVSFTKNDVVIHWAAGETDRCDYVLGDEGGSTINCPGEKPENFSLVPAKLGGTADDILIFRDTAWYREACLALSEGPQLDLEPHKGRRKTKGV